MSTLLGGPKADLLLLGQEEQEVRVLLFHKHKLQKRQSSSQPEVTKLFILI